MPCATAIHANLVKCFPKKQKQKKEPAAALRLDLKPCENVDRQSSQWVQTKTKNIKKCIYTVRINEKKHKKAKKKKKNKKKNTKTQKTIIQEQRQNKMQESKKKEEKKRELNAKTKKQYEGLKEKNYKQHESEIPFLQDMPGSL